MDELGPGCGSRAQIEVADIYQTGVLRHCGVLFSGLVGAFPWLAVLVTSPGSDWRCCLHLSDAKLFGDWRFPVRHHADLRSDHVDDGLAAPMVLDHVWCLLLRRLGLDDARHGLRYYYGA